MGASLRENPANAIAYHSQLAADWEQRYQKQSFQARTSVLEEVLSGLDLKGTCWLDAGCGTGTLARTLASRGCKVLAVDASQEMVRAAQQSSPSDLLEFVHIESIEHLPVQTSSQDGVLCSSVLEYVGDPARCLIEFSRVLRPGGWLIISVPNASSFVRWAQLATYRFGRIIGQPWCRFLEYSQHQFSISSFNAQLAHNGFTTQRVLPFGSPIPRWLQRRWFGGSLLMFRAVRGVNPP